MCVLLEGIRCSNRGRITAFTFHSDHQIERGGWCSDMFSAARRSVARSTRAPSCSRHRCAALHIGRATADGTDSFLASKGGEPDAMTRKLRVKATEDGDKRVSVGRVGVGSPYMWAKDIPRIDASKNLALNAAGSNFIQVSSYSIECNSLRPVKI